MPTDQAASLLAIHCVARGRVQRGGNQKEESEVNGVADQDGKDRNHDCDLNQALTFLPQAEASGAARAVESRPAEGRGALAREELFLL